MAVYKEIRKSDGVIVGRGVNKELPNDTEEFRYELAEGITDPRDVEIVKDEVIVYNASAFLAWCMSTPLQTQAFLSLSDKVQMLAISFTQTFALNCNDGGAALYRNSALVCDTYAGNTVCSEMAETVIAKAIELGANITQ